MALFVFDKKTTPVHCFILTPVVNFLTVKVMVRVVLGSSPIALRTRCKSSSFLFISSFSSTTFITVYSLPNTLCLSIKDFNALADFLLGIIHKVWRN